MKKYTIKVIVYVVVFAFICSLAVGCNKNTASSGREDSDSVTVYGMLAEVKPEEYRGTKIVEVTGADLLRSEEGAIINAFEQKYGIEYDLVCVDQSEAVSKIAEMLAADKQIDIYYDRGSFPMSLTVLQPLENAKLNFSSPIWNKAFLDASSVDGKPYVTNGVSSRFTELDICMFNKEVFDKAGLEYPSKLYEKGEWTFEAFKEAAIKISQQGKDYIGAGVLGETILGAFGCATFGFENGKVSVAVDTRYKEVLTAMSQMRVDGYIKLDRSGFDDGKQGMCFTDGYGLKKGGYFIHINPDFIGATYLPVLKKGEEPLYTAQLRGYGLIKNSKNPVAAGIYLSYCLNRENTKENQKNDFHNKETEEFFLEMSGNCPESIVCQFGYSVRLATNTSEAIEQAFMEMKPEEITPYIDSMLPTLNKMAETVNRKLKES